MLHQPRPAVEPIASDDGGNPSLVERNRDAEFLCVMNIQPAETEFTQSAEEAGLRYVSDEKPGYRRRGAGKGFSYIGIDGARITDPRLATKRR